MLSVSEMLDDSWVLVGDTTWNGQEWRKFSEEGNDDTMMCSNTEESYGKVEKESDWNGGEWNKYCH